jgi:hypothetical protein
MTIMTPTSWGLFLLFLANSPVLLKFWLGNRQTSLSHSLVWALVAWVAWIVSLMLEPIGSVPGPYVYLALALSGCASVAVLGARRPGVTMWNAVVLALLLMEMLPIAEALTKQQDLKVDVLRLTTLAGACFIGMVNYLPTRFLVGAALICAGCACEWFRFLDAGEGSHEELDVVGRAALAAGPGLTLLSNRMLRRRARNEFDSTWLTFRDRFGVVWGQRLREQFNQSARHANWPVVLTWPGVRVQPGKAPPDGAQSKSMLNALNALMKRFGKANVE